ncbi:thiol reductant ABC exporter subunit CydD [Schaalia sp. ZJ405]|uniref:thiol reductant ABC exporter subunit CydD n=1 Tax=Schaalia sp. ZJ405 TaxID=2709403 RepID=UPI0013ED313B|nr:thiol reductant ABC exporter subunit CydD [Schaalia sp. ZJ405]QPK81902.1 thiol reductant ABC exporter subunit CydD [Schaalia sp. ZJ405]
MRPLDPRLLKYARSARRHILLTAGLGIVTAALVIVQALLISGAASPVITDRAPLGEVLPLIIALICVVIARALAHAVRDATAHRAADRAIRELRSAVITHAEKLGPRWRALHASDTTTLLTRGLDDLSAYFVKFLPQLFLTCTVTPLALATILTLDFWSALIAALVVPLIPVFMILIGRFTQESSKAKLTAMERLGSQLLDLIAGLPTLRGLGSERGPRKHLEALGKQNTRLTMATLRVAFLSGAVLEFLATLSVALVAVEVGMRLVSGSIDLFSGLAVIMLAPEVFEPLRQVGAQFHASANGVAAAEAAFAIIEEPLPQNKEKRQKAPEMRTTDIVLDNVCVAARGAWAPAELSATITPGSLTALVGASGAGKTTTVMTILGVEPTTRGQVLLRSHGDEDEAANSCDLAEVDEETWWDQITWVPQAPTILPGTLLDNVTDGAVLDNHEGDGVNSERLREAAESTGFSEVVDALAHGWATRVGHGGVGLSVGQRQRLALTRAMLDDSPIVVLDEPTAHLDAVSEETVIKAIEHMHRQGRTVIVIAHRNAVVARADSVIDVTTRLATPEEIAEYPILVAHREEEDLSVTLPGFLNDHHSDTTDHMVGASGHVDGGQR